MFKGAKYLFTRMLLFILAVVFFAATFELMTPVKHVSAADTDKKGWTLVWNDEFSGTSLDRTKWDPWWPDQAGYYIHPAITSNGVNPNNVSLSGGTLKLKYSLDPITIGSKTVQRSSSAITSKYAGIGFKYGYIEARMNLNRLGGAFWLLPDEGFIDEDGNGSEVDIIECYGVADSWGSNQADNCLHWGGYGTNHQGDASFFAAQDIPTGWHKYAIEWDADTMKFYYDDKLVRTKYGEGIPQGFESIVFNAGAAPDSILPLSCEVDYVRVYQKNGTVQENMQQSYYGNYVANPGFETGSTTGWSGYGTWNVVNNNQYAGGYCARVAGGAAAEQILTGLKEGKTYTITANVKVDSGQTAYLGMNFIDNMYPSKQLYVTTTSTSYVKVSLTVKIGIYNRTAKVYLWSPGGSGYCYVDDITVIEEPNLCLDNPATASTVYSLDQQPQNGVDGNELGSAATKWCSNNWTGSPQWLQVDLRSNKTINRWTVVHAGQNESWGTQSINTRDFMLQYSVDGSNWSNADSVTGNIQNVTDRTFSAVTARYVRLYITNPQTETTNPAARIYEFKVYPQTLSGAASQPLLPSPSWMPAPAAMPNLAANGSFEIGDLTGWGQSYGMVDVINANPDSGNYCVRVYPGAAAQQTITGLAPNTTYVLNGSVAASNTDRGFLGVNFYGGAGQTYIFQDNWGFLPYTMTFTTGPGSTSALIYIWGEEANTGCIYGDTVKVYKFTDLTKINDSQTGTGLNQFDKAGSWTVSTGEFGCYYGDTIRSNTANDFYQIRFVGTKAQLYTIKDANCGIAAVSIDGGAETDVDLYSANRQRQALVYSSQDLAYGQHIIKVRVKGTKNANSSNYYVNGDMVVATGDRKTINDSEAGTELSQFNYNGVWTTTGGDGTALDSDYRTSAATNDYYEIKFSGSIVKVYATTNNNQGIAAISIDGGAETNVDMYSASKTGQRLLYTSPVLSQGVHTIKVRVTGTKNAASTGNRIAADRVDVFH